MPFLSRRLPVLEIVSDMIRLRYHALIKADAERRPTVHHSTVPEFRDHGAANRYDLAETGSGLYTRTTGARAAPWPANDEEEFLK